MTVVVGGGSGAGGRDNLGEEWTRNGRLRDGEWRLGLGNWMRNTPGAPHTRTAPAKKISRIQSAKDIRLGDLGCIEKTELGPLVSQS